MKDPNYCFQSKIGEIEWHKGNSTYLLFTDSDI